MKLKKFKIMLMNTCIIVNNVSWQNIKIMMMMMIISNNNNNNIIIIMMMIRRKKRHKNIDQNKAMILTINSKETK